MRNSTTRFSDRVAHYVQYRPTYPASLLKFIKEKLSINEETNIADIGSGTGILTELLLKQVKTVYAVEPNTEMRQAAEHQLAHLSHFKSIAGTAENTLLDNESVDGITVAQAFHWFDIPNTIAEFKRISKDNATLMLIWNRRLSNTPFLAAYEQALQKYGTDYNEINHQKMNDTDFYPCFKNGIYTRDVFENHQDFDFEGVIGFLNSTSYAPKIDSAEYNQLYQVIEDAFYQYATDGQIQMNYEAEIFWGKIK